MNWVIPIKNDVYMNYLYNLLLFVWISSQPRPENGQTIGAGIHPAVGTDPAGQVHVVFGQGNAIYYTSSVRGEVFSKPVLVDTLQGLHLGASRGPQIAATRKSVVIMAIDKAGTVWAYSLDRNLGKWAKPIPVTDAPEVAREGFVALTAGSDGNYQAVWLDLRGNRRNKLAEAHSMDEGRHWSPNRVIYDSPDGTICECCQPSIVNQGRNTAVLFRNSLNGARDMYLLRSADGGQTFGKAKKVGERTWQLKACPMDGGGLFISPGGKLTTVWRRADRLYKTQAVKPEVEIGVGKNAKVVTSQTGDYIVFQRDGHLWTIAPGQIKPTDIGEGAYPKLALLGNNRVLCLWEQSGHVRADFIQ